MNPVFVRIVVLFLATLLQRTAGANEVDLLIVAGQSNAVGYDAKPSELPKNEADREIRFWWRCGDPPPDESRRGRSHDFRMDAFLHESLPITTSAAMHPGAAGPGLSLLLILIGSVSAD